MGSRKVRWDQRELKYKPNTTALRKLQRVITPSEQPSIPLRPTQRNAFLFPERAYRQGIYPELHTLLLTRRDITQGSILA